LWRKKVGEFDTTAVNGPPEGAIGDNVYEHAMNATDGIPGDRSKSNAPNFIARKHKVDPISPENYDPWVYKISKENMGNFPQWHEEDTKCRGKLCNEPEFNVYHSAAQTGHKHKKHNKAKVDPISPENYDPWVYKISKENMGNFPQWHEEDTKCRGKLCNEPEFNVYHSAV
jgi:hypothetical protein